MRRLTTVVVLVAASRAAAQVPGPDTLALLDSAMTAYVAIARAQGSTVWPGFRPDTLPVALVVPRGTLIFNWTGPLPAGFTAVDGRGAAGWREASTVGAASTGVTIAGRGTAQVVVGRLDAPELIASALHEAFHVFQGTRRDQTRRFGRGENSFHVGSYPVFDATNEALFAMETQILARALTASGADRRALAGEFSAVRRQRHRRLLTEFAEFDRASEMNEGLAEYALVRALEFVRDDPTLPAAWRRRAEELLHLRIPQLRDITANTSLSFRLRYYHTGPVMARLLDALSPGWKHTLESDNLWIEDALAVASGLDDEQRRVFRVAAETWDTSAFIRRATGAIASLQERRTRQVDSILAQPGVTLVVRADSLPTRDFSLCGLDPQNLLQVTPHVRLQTRWWRPCSGGPTYVEFNVPSVHDSQRGTLTAVIGDEAAIAISSQGSPIMLPKDGETLRNVLTLRLVAPRATVDAVRADITRSGSTLVIWAKPPR